MTSGQPQFQHHIELLDVFIARRNDIVEGIDSALNAQRRPMEYLQDAPRLARAVEDSFFMVAGLGSDQARLRGQLEQAHRAAGFTPKDLPGLHNGLIEPAEMMVRAFHLWRQTRWPGRNGRFRYAHTLFNVYVIRTLQLLSMRLWDAGPDSAGDRLSRIQALLDRLWTSGPADQPVLLRDARWLIPMAQSPATDELGPYFDIAGKISSTLSVADRIGIHKANVRLAAGHLRSQTRYYAIKNAVGLDDPGLVRSTRNSNALDYALLIQDLVPLLEAYEQASHDDDDAARLDLADAICQAVSPDPELFLNRVDLLGAYSMIEPLFVTTDGDGVAAFTAVGRRHVQLFEEYAQRIRRMARHLAEDCPNFRPVDGACSPFGVVYGFSSDLLEHMVLKATQPDAMTGFGLEDVFTSADGRPAKLAWVNGWRKLPHLEPAVARLFDYPHQFAADMFGRVEEALRRSTASEAESSGTGRLFVSPGGEAQELPADYITSSDRALVAAQKAVFRDQAALSSDRREGKYLVSYETAAGWAAISKSVLTEVVGAGRDARLPPLPPLAAGALRLMYPTLVSPNV